jgi:L,D-transpeptidase catalytic domain
MPYRELAFLSRRSVLALMGLGTGFCAGQLLPISRAIAVEGESSSDDFTSFEPGQFFWHPERSPQGPVAIIVSIPKQLVFVYRNGILIGVSTCSTGKPGHTTPSGVFTVLEKAKTHTSVKYDEPMPDMQRLTWEGIALHVGDLPGYPDSHGCVHLPQEFADDVFAITQVGTPVIITGGYSNPVSVADPGPLLGATAEEEMASKAGHRMFSPSSPNAVVSILVSGADKKIYVLENANLIAEGAAIIDDPSKPLGANVFVWQGGDAKGSSWESMGFHADPSVPMAPDTDVLQRIDGAQEVMDVIRARIKVGTVLVTTDLPATPDTRSGNNLVVMDSSGH